MYLFFYQDDDRLVSISRTVFDSKNITSNNKIVFSKLKDTLFVGAPETKQYVIENYKLWKKLRKLTKSSKKQIKYIIKINGSEDMVISDFMPLEYFDLLFYQALAFGLDDTIKIDKTFDYKYWVKK